MRKRHTFENLSCQMTLSEWTAFQLLLQCLVWSVSKSEAGIPNLWKVNRGRYYKYLNGEIWHSLLGEKNIIWPLFPKILLMISSVNVKMPNIHYQFNPCENEANSWLNFCCVVGLSFEPTSQSGCKKNWLFNTPVWT